MYKQLGKGRRVEKFWFRLFNPFDNFNIVYANCTPEANYSEIYLLPPPFSSYTLEKTEY